MVFSFTSPYLFPLLVSALVSCAVAIYAWTRRNHTPSAIALACLAIATAEWAFGYALEIAGADLSTKFFWGKLQYLGIATVPFFWLIFAYIHANPSNRLSLKWIWLLGILPFITIVLGVAMEFHDLLWVTYTVAWRQDLSALQIVHGPWFWVTITYSYIYLVAGTFIILRSLGKMKGLYRWQTYAIILSVVAPWIGNGLYISGSSPIPYLDITPFAFTISVVGTAWGILGFRLMDITPLARDTVLENMREGMIVLDARGRIVDINPAAGRMIGLPATQAIGKLFDDALSPWPHLAERLQRTFEGNEVITIGQGAAQRRYAVQVAPIQDRQDRAMGRVISIHDLNEETFPEPRFAVREPATRPAEVEAPKETQDQWPKTQNQTWRWLFTFFLPPAQKDILVRSGVNQAWTQAIEIMFTGMLRVIATLGTSGLSVFLATAPERTPLFTITLLIVIGIIWFLALARKIQFELRISVFLLIVYALAFSEMLNYGYSAESFAFFLALVTLAVLLTDLKGGLWAFGVAALTMGTLGLGYWLRWATPLSVSSLSASDIFPGSLTQGLTSLAAFSACAMGLVAAINTLLNSLNRAWQKETQALNLLQQERDLLEQRVIERTRDLAETRDTAVQQSNELRKYFLAMEQSGNTIVITDPKGKIEYANPKFEALTGYSRAETLGKNPRLLKSGEHDRAYYKNLWDTIRAGNVWQGEFHNRRKDGSLFWESATIAPLINDNGEITNYIAIKEDISIQKELQERLREQNEALLREITARQRTDLLLLESEARFRQIVENASDIIYRTDANGYLTYVNPSAVRLMNFKTESELIGKYYLDIAIPSARYKLKRFYDHQFMTRTHATYYEFPAFTRDGREVWLGQSVQLIIENEKIIGFQAVARDISKLRQAQEALALSRDQALEASRLKSQLLSRVSHELRTPLGAIIGYSELLALNTFGALNDEQKDAATQILDSADYLSKMVNDLLDEAQAESKKISLHRTSFAPASLLEKTQSSLELLAQNKGLKFVSSLAPDLPGTLYEDERRLQQILINLTGNAIKFTQTGSVQIKIYPEGLTKWALQVSDTGVGIPKEAQMYIFEPFRQVDNSITRGNRGTGLGLSITKQLVELMDGEINLESAPGQGSTFTVILPIVQKPEH